MGNAGFISTTVGLVFLRPNLFEALHRALREVGDDRAQLGVVSP